MAEPDPADLRDGAPADQHRDRSPSMTMEHRIYQAFKSLEAKQEKIPPLSDAPGAEDGATTSSGLLLLFAEKDEASRKRRLRR